MKTIRKLSVGRGNTRNKRMDARGGMTGESRICFLFSGEKSRNRNSGEKPGERETASKSLLPPPPTLLSRHKKVSEFRKKGRAKVSRATCTTCVSFVVKESCSLRIQYAAVHVPLYVSRVKRNPFCQCKTRYPRDSSVFT